jgi:hypothetical protein
VAKKFTSNYYISDQQAVFYYLKQLDSSMFWLQIQQFEVTVAILRRGVAACRFCDSHTVVGLGYIQTGACQSADSDWSDSIRIQCIWHGRV